MSKRAVDLSQFDDDFRAEQPEERGDYESVPDGKYQVAVEKVELTEAQSTGNPMLKWTLRVIAPKFINRLMWRNSVITHNTLKYVKTDLHTCGLDLDKISELPKHLKKLLDVKLDGVWTQAKAGDLVVIDALTVKDGKTSALAKGLKDEQAMVSYLRPPFNKISEYREPGKVNINTIASPYVWQAVVNSLDPDLTKTNNWMPNWDEMRKSRRGDAAIPGITKASAGGSALFANPFRSGAGGAYGLPGANDSNTFLGVNASLLRQHADKHPLFTPLLTGAATPPLQKYNDYMRHPYFFFQNLQKISNLVTTRSNVYAVWITVGYFEAAPVSDVKNLPLEYQKLITAGKMPDTILSTIYPDGYVLGQELNADTGEIARHRAFYILDRTIPVAYERGEDHNVDNTILLRRLIE